MRKACLKQVYELARTDDRIFFIGSDLGAGTLDEFRKNIPGRFFMEGIAEANVIGMAAGLALEGKIVYVNTIATFLTRRCLEQLIVDVALHRLKVRLIGNGGGLVYAPLGPTHQAIDDIAILRGVPGFAVIAPADANEMNRLMPLTVDYPGPIYIRLAKGFDPIVTTPHRSWAIGRAIPYRRGDDALIVTTGIGLRIALEAAAELDAIHIGTAVLHVPTIKPFDAAATLDMARGKKVVVTVEEHTITGGLGSAVAESLLEGGVAPANLFKRIGVPDCFAEHYGSQAALMASFGIDRTTIVSTIAGAITGGQRG